jgi:hypothetical protein
MQNDRLGSRPTPLGTVRRGRYDLFNFTLSYMPFQDMSTSKLKVNFLTNVVRDGAH